MVETWTSMVVEWTIMNMAISPRIQPPLIVAAVVDKRMVGAFTATHAAMENSRRGVGRAWVRMLVIRPMIQRLVITVVLVRALAHGMRLRSTIFIIHGLNKTHAVENMLANTCRRAVLASAHVKVMNLASE